MRQAAVDASAAGRACAIRDARVAAYAATRALADEASSAAVRVAKESARLEAEAEAEAEQVRVVCAEYASLKSTIANATAGFKARTGRVPKWPEMPTHLRDAWKRRKHLREEWKGRPWIEDGLA